MKDALEKQIREIEQAISREEQKGPVEKLSDLDVRHQAVYRISSQISSATRTLMKLRRRYLAPYEQDLDACSERMHLLSQLPHHREILWAQQVLQLPNLLLVVIDQDVSKGAMDIFRLLAIDVAENVHFDYIITPRDPLSEHISYVTGVTPQEMEKAASMEEVWTDLLGAMSGKFILTLDGEDFQEQLEIYARHYGLQWPVIFGSSFVSEIETYFHITLHEVSALHTTSLNQLCWWVSDPLPPHPQQTARDRAKGYLHVLQAMAQGVIIIQPREQNTDEEYDEWEDNDDDWTDDEWEDERRLYDGHAEDDEDEDEDEETSER